jgi:hypothetical protein
MFPESGNGVSGNLLHAFVLEYLCWPFLLQSCTGSFDSAGTLLRKVPTPLRMTVQLYDDKLVSVSRIPGF